jgi:hypothetical protein
MQMQMQASQGQGVQHQQLLGGSYAHSAALLSASTGAMAHLAAPPQQLAGLHQQGPAAHGGGFDYASLLPQLGPAGAGVGGGAPHFDLGGAAPLGLSVSGRFMAGGMRAQQGIPQQTQQHQQMQQQMQQQQQMMQQQQHHHFATGSGSLLLQAPLQLQQPAVAGLGAAQLQLGGAAGGFELGQPVPVQLLPGLQAGEGEIPWYAQH